MNIETFDFSRIQPENYTLCTNDIMCQFYWKFGCRYDYDSDNNVINFNPGMSGLPEPDIYELQNMVNTLNVNYGYFVLRKYRNERLQSSDKYMIADYPISQDRKTNIMTYRQTLRDLPDILTGNNTIIDIGNIDSYFPVFPAS